MIVVTWALTSSVLLSTVEGAPTGQALLFPPRLLSVPLVAVESLIRNPAWTHLVYDLIRAQASVHATLSAI